MRKTCSALLTLALALSVAGVVQAEDSAKGIIAKAIKATGGEEKLAKFKAQTFTEKGTYYGMGNAQPYTGKYAIQFPSQFRMEIEGVFTIVLNGDKGWVKDGSGNVKEMTKDQLANQQEELYTGLVSTLVPLKEKTFSLTALGESKIDNRPALGVKVSSKGHGDVSLFFDKETGLLAKLTNRAKAEEQAGKEVEQDSWYSNYKEIDGVKVPMKMVMKRDGKQYVESEVVEIKAVGKLDDSVFAKP